MLFSKENNWLKNNKILESIKSKIGFYIRKRKQLKNIYIVLSNDKKYDNVRLYKSNIMRRFYFKMKFYYYNKVEGKEFIISNKMDRLHIYFDIKMNKQFIGLYEKRQKYFRDIKVSYYISNLPSYEKFGWFFAKRNSSNWYALSRIFGEPTFSSWTQSSTDENIHFGNFRAYQKWRKPKNLGTYGISTITEVDLISWLKNKIKTFFGFFHFSSNNNLKYNDKTESQIYESKIVSDLEYNNDENYFKVFESTNNNKEVESNVIYKLQESMLSWAKTKIKTKQKQKEKEKTEEKIERKIYRVFDVKDYILKEFLTFNRTKKEGNFDLKNSYNKSSKQNQGETLNWFDFIYDKLRSHIKNSDDFFKNFLLRDYWTIKNISHHYKKDELPLIYLIVDWLIIVKNDTICNKNIERLIDVILNHNENIFEYLLLFAYFLFFVAIINSIFRLFYNVLLTFNLANIYTFFDWRKFLKKKNSYYNFYEYYNRSFSKFYKNKKSINIESIIFFKDLIKQSLTHNKNVSVYESLLMKLKKSVINIDTDKAAEDSYKFNKELNSLLNLYSLLTQITVTKNFNDQIIRLILKKKSKFWINLKKTLNLNIMKQYYVWDYFNKHIFDEMFFNIELKDASFNSMLKNISTSKINVLYSNPLFYNKYSKIGISEKDWFFRYDYDLENIKALKTEIKDISKIDWYSKDWFRSRTNFFDLSTSKLRMKIVIFKWRQTFENILKWDFWHFIFKNLLKIFFVFFLLHYIIFTELWLTILSCLVSFILYYIIKTKQVDLELNKILRVSIISKTLSLIIKLSKIVYIIVIIYILYNIYTYILYNIYAYDWYAYIKLVNDKLMYTHTISEYLKFNELFLWIIKCLYLLETKKNNIKFYGFGDLNVLMKEFYLNRFEDWPKYSFFDKFFPFFRRWFYKLKIKRDEEEEAENYKLLKAKAVQTAKKTLSQITDTATFRRLFDFSFSTLIEEDFYKYLRNPYYTISYIKAHLILWQVEAYNEGLAKISQISNIYENYFYLYLQKTNLMLKIYFISKPRYYIYVQNIQSYFYFNRNMIKYMKYILLGVLIYMLILFLYFYIILNLYLKLISKNEIITKEFYLIWLNSFYKNILFSDNLILKTINNSKFISKVKFFILKQQFKILAETAKIKIIRKL